MDYDKIKKRLVKYCNAEIEIKKSKKHEKGKKVKKTLEQGRVYLRL
jgi:hypothetical protein